MLTFRHAGDIGDIIYSMPVMRAFGGGALLIEAASYTRQRLTPDKWCGLNELLIRQPYVQDVRPWRPAEPTNYNLNDFRARLFQALKAGYGKEKHLGHWMCEAHGVPIHAMDTQWLTIDDPIEAASVVFARSGAGRNGVNVYHNQRFPWFRVCQKYGKDAVFIGTTEEHDVFCAAFGPIPHYKTPTLLEAARVIAGAKLFVGNQSAPHAIAEGLKKNILLEVWPEGPNCCIHRPGVTHGWDSNVTLQEL